MKSFSQPIRLAHKDTHRNLSTLDEAIEALSDTDWPERGPRHRDALDICLKCKDGHRSIDEARDAVVLAGQEAGMQVDAD